MDNINAFWIPPHQNYYLIAKYSVANQSITWPTQIFATFSATYQYHAACKGGLILLAALNKLHHSCFKSHDGLLASRLFSSVMVEGLIKVVVSDSKHFSGWCSSLWIPSCWLRHVCSSFFDHSPWRPLYQHLFTFQIVIESQRPWLVGDPYSFPTRRAL